MTTQKIWFVLKTSTTVQRIRDIATQEKVKLFLPTYQVTEVRGKNKIQKEKSLTLDCFLYGVLYPTWIEYAKITK
jgi:hypothetical protein